MAKANEWGLIDNSDVVFINDKIVHSIASFVVSGSKLRWVDPLTVIHDWMLWSNFKTRFHRAEIGVTILAIKLDQAKNFSFLISLCHNVFSFFDVLNLFKSFVTHQNQAVTGEATSTSTNSAFNVIVGLSKG